MGKKCCVGWIGCRGGVQNKKGALEIAGMYRSRCLGQAGVWEATRVGKGTWKCLQVCKRCHAGQGWYVGDSMGQEGFMNVHKKCCID